MHSRQRPYAIRHIAEAGADGLVCFEPSAFRQTRPNDLKGVEEPVVEFNQQDSVLTGERLNAHRGLSGSRPASVQVV